MVRTTARPSRKAARRAFTLVELLVVIGIILLLVSLSVVAIMKAFGYQQRRNTETMIAKVNQALQKQWIRVIDMAKNEKPSPKAMALANNDPRLAQVIHIKLRLAQMFPTTFYEANNAVLGANPAYTTALKGVANRGWPHESSACLYLALKQSIRGGDFDPDTALSSQEVRDPVGDGAKEIFDGWGNPIVFSRLPGFSYDGTSYVDSALLTVQDINTKAYLLNPGQTKNAKGQWVPASAGNDPVDPENLLTDSTWVNSATGGQQYQTTLGLHPVWPGANYNLKPLIVSLGSDNAISPFTGDDVYSFQVTP